MWHLPIWPSVSPKWDDNSLKLLVTEEAPEIERMSLDEFEESSRLCKVRFTLQTVRCAQLKRKVSEDILERNINSAYPIIHEKVLHLCAQFLLHKRTRGSYREKIFYANLSLVSFIQRLLIEKAVIFVGREDKYLLIDGTQDFDANWELVGTERETKELNICKCLTYDEIKIGAFLSISSYTHFINPGHRHNFGRYSRLRENIEEEGVIIGVTGARFEREHVMEYQEIMVTEEQNTIEKGYGVEDSFISLIANFYDEKSVVYHDATEEYEEFPGYYGRYENDRQFTFFDNVIYSKRMSLSFDTLLLEANERAKEVNKMAFIHVPALNLIDQKTFLHQTVIFLKTFAIRLRFLAKTLTNVSDVFFDYCQHAALLFGFRDNKICIENHSLGGINVTFGKRRPHKKLTDEHAGKLLVVAFEANPNSLPGNEFWHSGLHYSNNATVGTSTQITELHNHLINRNVSVGNLRIATLEGVLTLSQYIKKLLSNRKK